MYFQQESLDLIIRILFVVGVLCLGAWYLLRREVANYPFHTYRGYSVYQTSNIRGRRTYTVVIRSDKNPVDEFTVRVQRNDSLWLFKQTAEHAIDQHLNPPPKLFVAIERSYKQCALSLLGGMDVAIIEITGREMGRAPYCHLLVSSAGMAAIKQFLELFHRAATKEGYEMFTFEGTRRDAVQVLERKYVVVKNRRFWF